MMRGLLSVSAFASLACTASLTVKSFKGDTASFIFSLASSTRQEYYVPSFANTSRIVTYETTDWNLEGSVASSLVPFTVFATNATKITDCVLENLYSKYLEDDIYTGDFLDGLYLSAPNAKSVDSSALGWMKKKSISILVKPMALSMPNTNGYSFAVVSVSAALLAPGPYLGSLSPEKNSYSVSLSKVYALFSDLQEAFMAGFTANDDGTFSYANLWDAAQYGLRIPVPSKLYYSTMDKAKYPLAGMRFAVKDLMPIAGVLLGGGSREMLRLYDTPDKTTAPAIQQLVDLGAVPIGKTKLTVFAFGAWPYQTDDFPYSWNPRADGYLGLSASSYGSAAAISAYDVLDFTIGSDTLGSVRNPADRAGVYGIRPTWGVMNLTDVIPSASSLDSLGLLARTPEILVKVAKEWDTDSNPALKKGKFSLPKKIIFPADFFPVNNSVAQDVIDKWLSNVTAALNVTMERQNVTELFLTKVDKNDTLANYTSTIGGLTTYDNYHLFAKKFLSDYSAKFGHYPELDTPAFQAWQAAPALTVASKMAMEQRRQDFENFINTHVIPFNEETCTDGIWVYHISDAGGGVPEYRDILTYDFFPPFKPMRGASIAPFAKLVDITVPIGAITYKSLISKRDEPLVITLNLVAHKGCDFVLLDFLSACAKAGLCKATKTGRFAF